MLIQVEFVSKGIQATMARSGIVTFAEGLQIEEGIEVLNKHVVSLMKQEDDVARSDLERPSDLHCEPLVLGRGLLPHEDVNSDIVYFFEVAKTSGGHGVCKHAEINPNVQEFRNKGLRNSALTTGALL